MTTIHHVYGAAIFETPWRLHIVFASIPVALIILAAAPIAKRTRSGVVSNVASWLYVAAIALFCIALIGFYEGGYNHLIPNIQYMHGVDHPLREGLYVPPDDLAFQLTGIAQFAAGLVSSITLWAMLRADRRPTAVSMSGA
jgi:hypothetical protein